MTSDVVTGINPEVARYLAAVEARLASLPPGERSELLEDLAGHLEELSVEGGPSLPERIGTPESYAAEFLASLGMTAAGTAANRRVRLAEALRSSAPVRALGRLWRSGVGQEGRSVWDSLRPAWWIARAYIAAALATYLIDGRQFPGFPVPNLLGHTVYGGVAIVAAIPLSVRLGRTRSQGMLRAMIVGANVAMLIFAGVLVSRAGDRLTASSEAIASPAPETALSNQVNNGQNCLTNGAGQLITNLYPYTPDGNLTQVLLYDQDGHAVDNLCPYYDNGGQALNTQYASDVNGAPVYNVFPRPQTVDVGSSQAYPPGVVPTPATSPVAPPAIVIPQLVTPTSTVTSTASSAGSP